MRNGEGANLVEASGVDSRVGVCVVAYDLSRRPFSRKVMFETCGSRRGLWGRKYS